MTQMQLFNFSGNGVRVINKDGQPWWVAKDVCEVLELSNATVAIQRLDQDEVTKFNLGGLHGETNIVNESGLYSLILGSRKPEAKQFKRWITHEVLPALRKEGFYSTSQSTNEATKLEIQKQRAEAMLKNAQTKQAKLLLDTANHFRDRLPDVTLESLIAAGTKTLTGQDLIPQRNVGQKFYTCEEIAKKIGMLSKNGKPHNQAVAALIKHIGFSDDEVVTVLESTGPSWQGTTDKYAESVLRRVEQKVQELGYPPVLNLGKSFNVFWAHQSA